MPNDFNIETLMNLKFEDFIRHITKITQKTQPRSNDYRLVENAEKHLAVLGSAYRQLSKRTKNKKKITSSGVEWFLDNFYVIQEAVDLILEDLPEGYFKELPSIEAQSGQPRTYIIARAFTANTEVEVVMNDLHNFLNHYQEEITLKMSELWALPLMLRLVMIEYLAVYVRKVIEDDRQAEISVDRSLPGIEPDEIIARAVRTLHTLNQVDWKDFFEAHAKVEALLREDPSGCYAEMDFETRDQYRKEIENLAQNCDYSELEVAETAISLTINNDIETKKSKHVGYFLIDKGKEMLKSQIGYRSNFSEKLRDFFFYKKTAFYLGGIGIITAFVLLTLLIIAAQFSLKAWELILVGVISVFPASSVAVQLVNSILSATLPPRMLPKMDFTKKIPGRYRTMVAIPALLTSEEEIDFLINQLELHYLANKDPNIGFILLLDYSDAPQETMPEDEHLLRYASDGIKTLNIRYQGDSGRKPFFFYHRCRQWNPKEDMWMGWERKRGKLLDFNRYLTEGFDGCIDTIIGDLDLLQNVKFVITVDSDTVMPRDSANALIATLAHPLNQAEFEEGDGRVKSGYTILQPRTEVKPTSVNQSLFTRIYAGDMGLDLYTRAVSNFYQDLFGEGIYVGKGIYDVDAFGQSLKNKVPNNTLLSHDLFEGLQGRAGLVTDIVFLENYPPTYASQVERRHRWIRGDWQLLPWLFSRVPLKDGKVGSNPFSIIDKWKIFDNLRRSLLSVFLLLSFMTGWLIFSDSSWVWTLIILFISAFPLFNHIVSSISSRLTTGANTRLFSNLKIAFLRWLFHIIFLVYDALIVLDAVITTLVRVFISHSRLLQWKTSAHTIKVFGKERKIRTTWKRMIGAPIVSFVFGIIIFLVNSESIWVSAPLLFLWAFSPQVAYWISLEIKEGSQVQLSDQQIKKLHEIARKTWLYFEHFIGPDDQWLPPDHFQEDPKGVVAHRTSPTNIGLMFLSTITAYELGYINILDFIYRMDYSFSTLDGLEKYRGHLLNWYDTQSLSTLSPRYVSTVDSGNFAMCLIGLYQHLASLEQGNLALDQLLRGMVDSLQIFRQTTAKTDLKNIEDLLSDLDEHCKLIIDKINDDVQTDHQQLEIFEAIEDRFTGPMNKTLLKILDMEKNIEPSTLKDIHYWWNAIHQQIRNIRRQIEILIPWLPTWNNRPAFADQWISQNLNDLFAPWVEGESLQTTIADMPGLLEETITKLLVLVEKDFATSMEELSLQERSSLQEWLRTFIEDLSTSKKNIIEHNALIANLKEKIDFYLERMEFDFLFDQQREVFHLGYQVGSGQLDGNHYDLFASEARTASLFAIAQNDVPRSHWLHMSRPFTKIDGIPTLVSWNGSMFEYLMPNLFTHTYQGTLLNNTNKGVVQAQISYGQKKAVPWGISESSYYQFDQSENYQYRGFGVPGLGRKRGLADDLVIAPYASIMAIDVDPEAVLENVESLTNEGAWGHFGFYESIDYTPSRLPVGMKKAVIKSYMAHHQGMVLVALGNFLNAKSIISHIHRDPRIRSAELLLQEQIPQTKEKSVTDDSRVMAHSEKIDRINILPWTIDSHQPGRQVHVISNDRLRMLITDTGSGYLAWEDIALTRWRQDAALDPFGVWFYVQDYDREKVWSLGREPISGEPQEYQVIFSPHKAEIRHVEGDIRMILQTTITPQDDVCIHKISLTNQSNQNRDLRFLSYGEVVLAPQATDRQHPAFNKLFIESKFDETNNMLYFQRRRRSAEEEPRGMAHVLVDKSASKIQFESDREKFIGRGHDIHNPEAISDQKRLGQSEGVTLDPIFSLGKRLSIEPHQTIILNYLTIAAETIEKAKSIAQKYEDQAIINTAFDSSQSASERQLRSLLDLDSDRLSIFQELLSRVIYPVSELRPPATVLRDNVLGQSGLWRFGISGDYPMLLTMIDHQNGLNNLQEVIQAHKYWRKLGLMIDLVILNTKDMGYTHELNERIHRLINLMESQSWVNQRGGIFILTASQTQEEALALIKSVAKVVIDVNADSLLGHLNKAKLQNASLPNFVAIRPRNEFISPIQVKRPENLVFDNGLGGFTPDGKEYQIFLQDYPKLSDEPGQLTPAPWINVMANEKFGCLLTESGGGYTWSENSGENRLTPWTNDPISDPPGEVLYLRDELTGNIWSATPAPAGHGRDYLVRHGQGYSIFESTNQGFEQQLKIFVDPEESIKYFELTLKNKTNVNRRLTTTLFAEWVLQSNREISKSSIIPEYDHENGTLFARNPYNEEFSKRVAFISSDHPVHDLTTDRREFFGSPGQRRAPEGLQRIGLSGAVEPSVDACAALQNHLNFKPNQEHTIIYILGQASNKEEATVLAKTYSNADKLNQSWKQNQQKWDDLLGAIKVETPSDEMNLILNRWLLYQALSCRIWGRSAFYQSSGAYGFRDQLQDVISVIPSKPEISREHILRAARHQFEVGDVLHWWHPPSGRGVRTKISDDLLWLVYTTYDYVSKTGDSTILEETIPFIKGDPLGEDEHEHYDHFATSEESASLFEHCQRALQHADTEGPHGLPLIGSGDWNDGMNRVGIKGQGESVWLAWFLVENHRRFAGLCKILELDDLTDQHLLRANRLQETIDQVAWDGNWYLRAYYDDGTPLGSHRNKECQIDSLPQSWGVLTGSAPKIKQEQAMQAVKEHLVQEKDHLIKLFTPPFDETLKDPGYIKGYPPGIRENGGQYTHAAIWAVWALTHLGQGDEAFKQFSYLNPINHAKDISSVNQYAVEPYVVAADIYSTQPFIGHGGWTWYTGSSGWLYRLGLEAILGFNLEGDHFTMDPCIPSDWDGFKFTYEKDRSTYIIEVENPNHVQKGVKKIIMDGEELEGNRIYFQNDQREHQIRVSLG